MSATLYRTLLTLLGVGFATAFCVIVLPALIGDGDILGAFAAGFVNPYASGYALDAILCWLILATWVLYERKAIGVRFGWLVLLIGIVPGVASGFAMYLVLRSYQLGAVSSKKRRATGETY